MKKLGERIKSMLEAQHKNIRDLTDYCEVSVQTGYLWLADNTKPKGERLTKCANFFGLTEQEFLYGEDLPSKPSSPAVAKQSTDVVIRRVAFKSSGKNLSVTTTEGSTLYFSPEWLESHRCAVKDLMATEILDASMEPSLYKGDVVVINVADTALVDGTVFAFNLHGHMIIRRLVRSTIHWILLPDNTDERRYPQAQYDAKSAKVLGRVIHKQSDRI